jgi:hypothetical protein
VTIIKEPSLFPKRADQCRATTHPLERSTSFTTELPQISRAEVWQLTCFPVSPEILDRIELGCIRGQELEFESSVLARDEVAHKAAAVLAQAVPDNKHIPMDMSQQMRQEDHYLWAAYGTREQPKVEVPQCYPGNSRECPPVEMILKHRRLPARGPSAHTMRLFAQSAFVDEDDGLPADFGVFFSSGHRSRFHRRIFPSSRSKARRVGRCGVHPRARSTRHAWTVEYLTPHSRSIRSATRQAVHRLVPYPIASGPRLSPCSIRRRSAPDRCGGRPVREARFNADRPPLTSCFAQRFTDCLCTPTCRATSASLIPSSSSRAACMRRRSNFTRSNLTPAGCPMPGSIHERSTNVTRLCNIQ